MSYRSLDELERQSLAAAIVVAEQLLAGRELQLVYDEVLAAKPVQSGQLVEMIGYMFGNSLVAESWLEWAMLIDPEYGDEISVRVQDRELGCAPLSMIRNRLEDAEQCSLAELRESTVHRLRQLAQHAA